MLQAGATKTRLMHSACLSYAQIQEYLKFVKEKGLLAYEEGVQQYGLTEKGLRFLHSYEEISELVALPKPPGCTRPTSVNCSINSRVVKPIDPELLQSVFSDNRLLTKKHTLAADRLLDWIESGFIEVKGL